MGLSVPSDVDGFSNDGFLQGWLPLGVY